MVIQLLRIDNAERELLYWLKTSYPRIYEEWVMRLENKAKQMSGR